MSMTYLFYYFYLSPAIHCLQQSITRIFIPDDDDDSGDRQWKETTKTNRVNSTSPQDSSKPYAVKSGPNSGSVPPPVTSTAGHVST